MSDLMTLVDAATKRANAFRSDAGASMTFSSCFHANVLDSPTSDDFLLRYQPAYDKMSVRAGTPSDFKALKSHADGKGKDSPAVKAYVKADSGRLTAISLKTAKSAVLGCLREVRDMPDVYWAKVWEGVTAQEWTDTLAMVKLAGCMEYMRLYVANGGTPDAPNRKRATNRAKVAAVVAGATDLESAILLLVTESLDESAGKAYVKAGAKVLGLARERIASMERDAN